MKHFYILDERNCWHAGALAAAARFGYEGKRIALGEQVAGYSGLGFIRPHAEPMALRRNRDDFDLMAERLTMIQDRAQVRVYEDKSEQWRRWGRWMPETHRFDLLENALAFVATGARFPLVSKADVGASSYNVRILNTRAEAEAHVRALFGPGIEVHHCSGGVGTVDVRSTQKGYALLQEFIPHTVTWRVNVIGAANAVFRRFNYDDRPVARTGNTEPVERMTEEVESLLDYANRFFAEAGTRWCAIDVLKDADGNWKLLETGLAWPWPSPGRCDDAVFFGTDYLWRDMFGLMFDQVERGAFAANAPARERSAV